MSTLSGPLRALNTCFAPRELELLSEIRALEPQLPKPVATEIATTLDRLSGVLAHLSEGLNACPALQDAETIAGRTRTVESLIERLCQSQSYTLDFLLPTRAILGQALLHAKINFFKAFRYVLDNHSIAESVLANLNEVLGDALYFRLAEELLVGCISNASNSTELKRAAATRIVPLWEQRHSLPLEDFTGLLISAWRARCRFQEVFGTLMGFHEAMSLLQEECEPEFLDFFSRDVGTPGEREALREFLFGLSYEELQKLGTHMEERGIQNLQRDDVPQILGRAPQRYRSGAWTPETVYFSYRRRRVRASYRALTKQPGPFKTAEGYLMEYYLLRS